MANESVTLSIEDVTRIQDRLLVGLSAYAEIMRVRSNMDNEIERTLREANAFPMIPACGDDEYGEFATALHTLHIACSP